MQGRGRRLIVAGAVAVWAVSAVASAPALAQSPDPILAPEAPPAFRAPEPAERRAPAAALDGRALIGLALGLAAVFGAAFILLRRWDARPIADEDGAAGQAIGPAPGAVREPPRKASEHGAKEAALAALGTRAARQAAAYAYARRRTRPAPPAPEIDRRAAVIAGIADWSKAPSRRPRAG